MFNLFGNKNVTFIAPIQGKIVDITEVSDQAFSQKFLGDGIAVEPSNGTVVAPCDGKVTQIFPTNHAFGITTKEGLEILVHIGMDTVQLEGNGFTKLVEVGSKVKQGTPIIEVDFEYIKSQGKETITPFVITNMDKVETLEKNLNDASCVMTVKAKK